MTAPTRGESRASIAAGVLNLLAPGSGLSLMGSHAWGIGLALAFAGSINGLIASIWLFPDEVPPHWRPILGGVAGLSYLLAQIRLEQTLRSQRAASAQAIRRGHLASVQDFLARGDAEGAHAALQPLLAQSPDELLVALLRAETLTGLGRRDEALGAWEALAALDRHHLYRTQIAEGRARLNPEAGTPTDD